MAIHANPPTHSEADSQQFIEQLNAEALNHRALHHPFLERLASGDFIDTRAVLKDFLFQYQAYSVDFIRYLTVTISKLDLREHRELLIANLIEESGHVDDDDAALLQAIGIALPWVQGVPHPQLYNRFLDAIGYDESFRANVDFCDEAKIWRKMFLAACSDCGADQSLGAMGLGTENIVKYIYAPILTAIKQQLDVTPEQRVFFDLHALLDDEHGEVLNDIAAHYARYERHRESLRDGMLMALNLRAGFFDAMLARADASERQQAA